MLKQLIKKLLGFFAVAIGGKDYGILREGSKAPNETALPVVNGVVIGKDIKSVVGGPGYSVLEVYGRQVYVPSKLSTENGVRAYTWDLTDSNYVKLTVDENDRDGRNQPRHDFEWIDEPLSEKTINAVAALHEYFRQEDEKNPPDSKHISRIILPPPNPIHPKESAATPQDATDHPQP